MAAQATRESPGTVTGSAGIFVAGIGSSVFGGKRAREEDKETSARSGETQNEGPSKKTKTMVSGVLKAKYGVVINPSY